MRIMQLKQVINVTYAEDDKTTGEARVRVLYNNGDLLLYNVSSLEYPYFYSGEDISRKLKPEEKSKIIKVEEAKRGVITPDGIMNVKLYKVETKTPTIIGTLKYRSRATCEADIPYLERRLGADGVIEWANTPSRYAFIDVEEANGVITLIGYEDSISKTYIPMKTVKELLVKLMSEKITIILAWNGYGYDFHRLDALVEQEQSDALKRWWNVIMKMDAMQMYSQFLQVRIMSLENAGANEELGGKLKLSKPFNELTEEELTTYNKRDVELLRAIVEKTDILNLNFELANYIGVIPTEISAMRMVDNLMIKQYREQNIVLLDKRGKGEKKGYEGATVLEPVAGVHKQVGVIDITSLYPNVIIHNEYKGKSEFIYNIVKSYIKKYMLMREKYKVLYKTTKENEYDVKQKMYKVLMNSIYGVFGNEYYRYFQEEIAAFITMKAREVRADLQLQVENLGFNVIASDTDSIFIENISKEMLVRVEKIINRRISPFEVKIEKYFTKAIMLKGAGGKAVKKRYVGVTDEGELEETGVELVRGDWSGLAQDVERRVFEMILKEDKEADSILEYIESIRQNIKTYPIEKFLFSKVVDLEKKYVSKTRVVKAFQSMGGKVIEKKKVEDKPVKNKKTGQIEIKSKEKTIYLLQSNNGERLKGVRWVCKDDGEPVGIEETEALEKFKSSIGYNFYWEKQIVAPIDRVLMSLGHNGIEIMRNSKRKRVTEKTILNRVE